MWQQIADVLLANDIKVYPPAVHRGECTEEYCVLKDSGASPLNTYSSQRVLYDLMCYVPHTKYTTLESFVLKCKKAMEQTYPMLLPTGLETPSFYDDTVKGYMVSVEYRASRRNKRI